MPPNGTLPKEDLVRLLTPGGYEVRDESNAAPTLFGHFAVFDRWTEINSWFEGNFMERIAPGAFKKTIRENIDRIKVTLNHGQDPELGDKPLGRKEVLEEDSVGGRYEVSLFRGIPELVMEGLRAGEYGASFRFSIVKEEFDEEPAPADHNPKGLPERSLTELRLHEFGPVTFPAYADATAGVRSLTAEMRMGQIDPQVLLGMAETAQSVAAMRGESLEEPQHSTREPAPATPASRSTRPGHDYLNTGKEQPTWRI